MLCIVVQLLCIGEFWGLRPVCYNILYFSIVVHVVHGYIGYRRDVVCQTLPSKIRSVVHNCTTGTTFCFKHSPLMGALDAVVRGV
jgi:hypothetical protein